MSIEFIYLLKGIVVGIIIAAPVGAIGALCIKNSIMYGFGAGFATGLGAATADTLYGAIAAFGLTMINDFLVTYNATLSLIGGVVLCYLGYRTMITPVPQALHETRPVSLIKTYVTTLLLTITNPSTIIAFLIILSNVAIVPDTLLEISMFVSGVFAGSVMWWLGLSSILSLVRKRIQTRTIKIINISAGIAICILGILAFLKVLLH